MSKTPLEVIREQPERYLERINDLMEAKLSQLKEATEVRDVFKAQGALEAIGEIINLPGTIDAEDEMEGSNVDVPDIGNFDEGY